MQLLLMLAAGEKRLLCLLFSFLVFHCTSATAQPAGYAYGKSITIQASQILGTVANFPVLISFTDNDLRTVANGGHVQHSSGYDIVFTLMDGSTLLNHQIERYVPATGEYIAWVNLPALSSSSNTIIAMFYGNPAVSANPSSTAVWDSDYLGVWHFNNSVNDATAYARNPVDKLTSNLSTSKIGEGRILNNNPFVISSSGSCQHLQFGSTFNGVTNFTFEGWVFLDAISTNWERIFDFGQSNTSYMFLSPSVGTNGVKRFAITNSGNLNEQQVSSATTAGTGAWHHFAVSIDNSNNTAILYYDGVADNTNTAVTLRPTNILPDGLNWFGRSHFSNDHCLYGKLDEFRISSTVRNANWIRTAYNNQNNPSGFYTVSSELTAAALMALLPVKLQSFKASVQPAGSVVLVWTTALEVNSEKFVLQRSGDGMYWTAIQTIPAAVTGNPHTYTATDEHPIYPVSYYRLQQTDRDGRITYSFILPVSLRRNGQDLLIHPNPARERVTILFRQGMPASVSRVELLNGKGEKIILKGRLNSNVLELPTSGLPSGVYWVNIPANRHAYTGKLVIAR